MQWMLWALTALLAACASDTGTGRGRVTNLETSGNLEAREIGCLSVSSWRNTYTAADYYRGELACRRGKDFQAAARQDALAGVYARFDTFRVADRSAHQAHSVMRLNLGNASTEQERQSFTSALKAMVGNPQELSMVCADIRRLGPPDYHPRYMIQHGLMAFTRTTGDGLIPGFDAAAAWERALDSFLHCPSAA